MPVHVLDSAIFRDLYGSAAIRAVFDDRALIQYWLDVEAALARAEAELGLIPAEAADEIASHCSVDQIDLDELRAQTELVGYPILPLVRQVERHCRDGLGGFLHWGATTQDIMDTAVVLQMRDAFALLQADLSAVIAGLARLARTHRGTVMAGRTHLQHALTVTFGYKVAVWLSPLITMQERLAQLRPPARLGDHRRRDRAGIDGAVLGLAP